MVPAGTLNSKSGRADMNLRTLFTYLLTLLLPLWPMHSPAADTSKTELVILNWADYIDPEVVADFEAKH